MFASNEKNVAKKSFQKPNILRRKGKASIPKANITNVNESPEAISLVTTSHMETNISDQLDNITKLEGSNKLANVIGTVWGLSLADCEDYQNNLLKSRETDIHANLNSNAPVTMEIKSEGKSLEQNTLNIESFLNSAGSIGQELPMDYDATVSTEKKTSEAKPKWCFDITNNSMDIIINNHNEHKLEDLEERLDSVIVVPFEPVPGQQPQQVHDQAAAITPTQSIPVNYSNRAVKFKCDQPNCNKGFWSEEKLKKHKNSHKRQAYRTPTQITYECPVKKKAPDGVEEKCPRTFVVRGDLLKHLDEDHTLEEAAHRCDVCGRRFFWAMGLRAHGTSLCARGGLACAWPGCGRVFRLPCRLREHARAHTGDRPYLCRYPDCGWAFRSASKLVRHARRHTDERRHACATCGRAFLRREHLRDHAARHRRPQRAAVACSQPGCEQSFTNMSTLYMHMKKVHRKGKEVTVAAAAEDPPATVSEDGDYVYLVSLPDNIVVEEEDSKAVSLASAELEGEYTQGAEVAGGVEESGGAVGAGGAEEAGGAGGAECARGAGGAGGAGGGGGGGGAGGAEWHAARTHCTWPLPRAAHAHYVLDDDVHVERAEGSVSDVYTVRSDLFLHGNIPLDDDSQHIAGAALGGAPDADWSLVGARPTIDLMQEELMYEDAADESSFRVFLMNGEELS